jgi:phosphoglycolate phosphatase
MHNFPSDIVGFDLDGTLIDSKLDLGIALNHALEQGGFQAVPLDHDSRLGRRHTRADGAGAGGSDVTLTVGLTALAELVRYYRTILPSIHACFGRGGYAG